MRILTEAFGPIMLEVMEELGDDPELLGKWAFSALIAHGLAPELLLTHFLPDQLDETLSKIRARTPGFLTQNSEITQVEDTP